MPVLPASNMAGANLALAPIWLNTGNNRNLLITFGDGQQAIIDKMRQAMRAHLPGEGTVTALPYIGDDRVLPKGTGETDDAYAIRLRKAFATWQKAGSARAVMSQCIVYAGTYIAKPANFTDLAQTVQNSDGSHYATWNEYYTGSDTSLPPAHITKSTPNWNWDNHYDWWRTWLVMYAGTGSVIAAAPPWGAGVWGDPNISWGFNIPSSFFAGLRRTVRQWKSAGTYYPWVIFSFAPGNNAGTVSPLGPSSTPGVGNPDGTWGHWGTVNGNGFFVPSRPSTFRFVDGSDVPVLNNFQASSAPSVDGIGPIMSTAFAITDVPLVVGDAVAITTAGHATKALTAALAISGAVIGVAVTNAPAGGTVVIQTDGILSQFITGLSSAGPVDVNPATGRLRVVGSFAAGAYPIGYATSTGIVTMVRGLALNVSGPAVTYTSMGGLIADYDANLLPGANGSSVASWPDSTPSAQNLLQATGANQPTIVTPAVFGKKAVSFNGSSQFMRVTNFIINSREMTVYLVMQLRVVGSGGFVFEYNVSTCAHNHAGATGFPQQLRGGGSAGYLTNIAGTGFAIRSLQFRDDNTNELFYQGVSRNTFTDSTAIPPNAAFDLAAHANGASLWAPIDVSRILVYNCKHTAAQGKTIYNLLAVDYGFAVLP